MRCVAYCPSTSFDMVRLLGYLRAKYNVTRFREVLHVQMPSKEITEGAKEGDAFFFPYGALVFWGLEESQEAHQLEEIRAFELQPVDQIEDDVFSYEYGSTAKIEEDEIILPDIDVLTKLAFSHGMAQSVKLAVFEQTIQKTIHLTRQLPELLERTGSVQLSRKDIRRMMGRLFIDRSSINLHQELLDTPEFFWEHSDLEPYYAQMAHYLDRERRVSVLNQRLIILQELFDMLAAELNHQHSSRLEWTIIWLIVIEVVMNIARDFLKLF
jgi:uncharacterized Rmd1/YagE family protein